MKIHLGDKIIDTNNIKKEIAANANERKPSDSMPALPSYTPLNLEGDETQVSKETELATALNVLVKEYYDEKTRSNNLDKVGFLNEMQTTGMQQFEAIKVLGGGIPLRASVITDTIKRLSQSKNGFRSTQIKDMVIGQKNQPTAIEQVMAKLRGGEQTK